MTATWSGDARGVDMAEMRAHEILGVPDSPQCVECKSWPAEPGDSRCWVCIKDAKLGEES